MSSVKKTAMAIVIIGTCPPQATRARVRINAQLYILLSNSCMLQSIMCTRIVKVFSYLLVTYSIKRYRSLNSKLIIVKKEFHR